LRSAAAAAAATAAAGQYDCCDQWGEKFAQQNFIQAWISDPVVSTFSVCVLPRTPRKDKDNFCKGFDKRR
jgi:hypothetical protein